MPRSRSKRSTKRKTSRSNKRKGRSRLGTGKKAPAKAVSKAIEGVLEMRRRQSGLASIYYSNQGQYENEDYYGLSTTQSVNVIVDPLNYGWQNAVSDPGGITRQFRGKDIFVRYWKMKYKFDFPTGDDGIRLPMRIQLIHGFCTNPTQYTPYTTPKDSTVTAQEFTSAVLAQVEDAYNSPDDQLEFRIKNKSNMRILGKKWIQPDRTARVGMPQQFSWATSVPGGVLTGGPPDVTGTLSWPINRKIRMTYTSNGDGDSMNYNNESWIPFVCIYSPDYDSVYNPDETEGHVIPADRRVQFQHNSCVWYQDP